MVQDLTPGVSDGGGAAGALQDWTPAARSVSKTERHAVSSTAMRPSQQEGEGEASNLGAIQQSQYASSFLQ